MNLKHVGFLLISVLMVISSVSAAYAADTDSYVDYSSVLHKKWIVKEENPNDEEIFFKPDFSLEKVDGVQVEGTLRGGVTHEIIEYEQGGYKYHKFQGTIYDGVIEGSFQYGGAEGKAIIEFLTEDEMRMYIHYTGPSMIVNRTYTLRTLTYDDSKELVGRDDFFKKEMNKVFPVHIDNWGQVYIRTVVVDTLKPYPLAFLTDKEGNIYQELLSGTNGFEFNEVEIKDINGDGVEDIQIGAKIIEEENTKLCYNLIQDDTGYFHLINAEYVGEDEID